MKIPSILLAAVTASAFAFSPTALHAQDQGAPPPPMDQGAPPPPPDGQGAPPPPDGQGAPPPDQQGGGDSGASFDEFYNNLSSDGQWVQTPDYGYAFQPNVQDPNWAPYTDGHWVYTDYGWTWASDEPWGWATYHYGRWVNVVGSGWMWVPGYQWAPAWVSWRYGGGYCGWAPLPPSSFVGVEFGGPGVNLDFGFHFGGDCDTAYGIGPGCYNFIQIGFIGDPYYRGHYIDRGRNFVIINNTRNITSINVRAGGRGAFGAVNVGGPRLADVNAVSHTRIQEVRIAQTNQVGRGTVSGGTLNVFAPRINPATRQQARPTAVSHSLSNVQINRGTSISEPLQVNSRFKPAAPSATAINAAREAQAHAPQSVATAARFAPTTSAAQVQQERTQSAQHQQTEALQQHNAGATANHTTGGSPQHTPSETLNNANTQAEHNTQVEREQTQRQQQNQEQERQAATSQQREETLRQQQNQEQERQAAVSQQREQQQSQAQTEARERAAAAASQERAASEQHTSTQEHTAQAVTPQHTPSPQPQEQHAPAPQQHPSGGGGENHSSGGGGNHSSGGGNSGGNHGNGQNNNGQGH